jgi:hypothetical protein
MSLALQRACCTIDEITKNCKIYTYGVNDCFSLITEYDYELRGTKKAKEINNEPYNSVKGWLRNLIRLGFTLETYAEACGYEVVKSKRPKLGDIAFHSGGLAHNGTFWISTNENNSGTEVKRQAFFLERHVNLIARPIRN